MTALLNWTSHTPSAQQSQVSSDYHIGQCGVRLQSFEQMTQAMGHQEQPEQRMHFSSMDTLCTGL